ncbi:MAG TPA: hypothetical protein EYH20_05620 [Leucothrix sp.]|nr:hypothetical protein [Leucothrix sp.]
MNREQEIIEVAKIIEDWNPLGEMANSIDQLEGYRYEAMDILSTIDIIYGKDRIKDAIETVLIQAFNIELDQIKLEKATSEIQNMLVTH